MASPQTMFTNGAGLSAGAKAVTALGSTGALIIIAGYLVYALVQGSGVNASQTAQIAESVSQHIEHSTEENQAMTSILRKICVNTAADPSQRSACFN